MTIELARTDCYGHEPIYMDERAVGLGFRCLKCGLSLPTPVDAPPRSPASLSVDEIAKLVRAGGSRL